MLNLLKYSQRYFATSGSFWNFYTDEIDDVNNNASNCKSFNIKSKNKKKTKKEGKTPQRPGTDGDVNQPLVKILHVKVKFFLKYLNSFTKSLNLPLINCEIELDMSWTRDCVLTESNNNITGVNFVITTTKRYASVVIFSINENIKFYKL